MTSQVEREARAQYAANPAQYPFVLSQRRLAVIHRACGDGRREVESVTGPMDSAAALPLEKLIRELNPQRVSWVMHKLENEPLMRTLRADMTSWLMSRCPDWVFSTDRAVKFSDIVLDYLRGKGKIPENDVRAIREFFRLQARNFNSGSVEYAANISLAYYDTPTVPHAQVEDSMAFLAEMVKLRVLPYVKNGSDAPIVDADLRKTPEEVAHLFKTGQTVRFIGHDYDDGDDDVFVNGDYYEIETGIDSDGDILVFNAKNTGSIYFHYTAFEPAQFL